MPFLCVDCKEYLRDCLCDDEADGVCTRCGNAWCGVCDECDEPSCACDCDAEGFAGDTCAGCAEGLN